MSPESQRWFTINEAAIYLRCSPSTIRNLIHRGAIRAAKLGDWDYRIDRLDLDHYLEKRKKIVAPYRVGTHPAVAQRHAAARKRAAR